MLGGGSIMILLLGVDSLLFRPLATPTFLADALIGQEGLGLDFTAQLRAVRIVMFTVLHLAVFTVLGIILAKLVRMSEIGKSLLVGGLYGLTVCTLLFGVVLHLSGTELVGVLPWPAVILGNFIAGVVMVGYLKVRTA